MAINHYLGSVRNRQQPAEFTPVQPSQNICSEVSSPESEVFYGPRANLTAYSNARQSYQRLCATTPTTPAEYALWADRAKSLQHEMSQLQSQDGKFNAEVAAAVEFYPEYLLITSAALQAVGAGMQESFVRAGRYQVENPHVPLGAVRHFAAQQGEGLVTSFTNFWPAYDAIQTAKANKAQLSQAEYIQQVGGSVPGVAAPFMVAAGVRAGLKSVANATLPKGGAPLAVTPEGFAVAGVSAGAEGTVAQAGALAATFFRANGPGGEGDPFEGMGEWASHNLNELLKLEQALKEALNLESLPQGKIMKDFCDAVGARLPTESHLVSMQRMLDGDSRFDLTIDFDARVIQMSGEDMVFRVYYRLEEGVVKFSRGSIRG